MERLQIMFNTSLIAVILVMAAINVCLAVSVNAGRISQLADTESRRHTVLDQLSRSPAGEEGDLLRTRRNELQRKVDELHQQINYGNVDLQAMELSCLTTVDPRCFRRNPNETNNFFIAVGAGVIGASILALRLISGAMDCARASRTFLRSGGGLLLGGGVGLLVLFFAFGTKGSMSASVSGVVEVDNPYGLAFLSAISGLFSDKLFEVLEGWMGRLGKAPERREEKGGAESRPAASVS